MINWIYLAASSAAFLAAVLVGWSDAAPLVKAVVLTTSLAIVVALRFALARQLSFQYLLFARASIWMMVFVLVTSAMITAFGFDLSRAGMAAVLFGGVFGVFAVSLMMFTAIGKPCPACDGQSPIQVIKGPTLWGGTDGFQLRFWQSGVAERCPICEADWSFTEAALREARRCKDQANT